ncbi:MAG TPA: type II toxin-antitoxin system RelE/ParE family toxin [Candidatus Acidoferrum sp.]|nr:type II toxin-antitoxin system RelE/ParE family toxin [Candidatus Acidoferrum sp.]
MLLRWTPEAAANLEEIYSYLVEHYPQFADLTITQLYEGIKSLAQFPSRGRPGSEAGVRELVFVRLPYFVAYRVKEETIEILHVRHTARQR